MSESASLNAHVYPSPLTHESRMLRITDALARTGRFASVELIGIGSAGLPARQRIDAVREIVRLQPGWHPRHPSGISRLLQLLAWSLALWRYMRNLPVTCINAHSLSTLPVCAAISHHHRALLVYEPHELETESVASTGVRRTFARLLERWLIGRCHAVFVVSDSIASWYASHYRIIRPTVIRNFPTRTATPVADRPAQRVALGLDNDALVFIYQGAMTPGRGIERLLRVFCRLEHHQLLLLGDGALVPVIVEACAKSRNIRHHPAVAPEHLLAYTACADVGLCITEPVCLSYAYSLPNKLFEYLAAGLPVMVSDLPEQAGFVSAHACGWIVPADDAAFAGLLESIDLEMAGRFGQAVLRTAQTCQWDLEATRLAAAYRELGHD